MARFTHQAFHQICKDAVDAVGGHYVTLMESQQVYLGPEEGGTYGRDTSVVAYQRFDTQEAALAAYEAVKKLADELSHEARREHGRYCLQSMDWLEARGLDADFLPEPDGPCEFHVVLTDHVPEGSTGSRHYE